METYEELLGGLVSSESWNQGPYNKRLARRRVGSRDGSPASVVGLGGAPCSNDTPQTQQGGHQWNMINYTYTRICIHFYGYICTQYITYAFVKSIFFCHFVSVSLITLMCIFYSQHRWAQWAFLDNFGPLSTFPTTLRHDPDPEEPETGKPLIYTFLIFWPILFLAIVLPSSDFWVYFAQFWPRSGIFGHFWPLSVKFWPSWAIIDHFLDMLADFGCKMTLVENNAWNCLNMAQSGLKWPPKCLKIIENGQR